MASTLQRRGPKSTLTSKGRRPEGSSNEFAGLIVCLCLLALPQVPVTLAQTNSQSAQPPLKSGSSGGGCPEPPREDALVATCAPPSLGDDGEARDIPPPPAKIALQIPSGTPIRIALDQRVPVAQPGELVHGKVVETVYVLTSLSFQREPRLQAA
jgi:hypothetical protein